MNEQLIDAYALSDFMRDHWQERVDEELKLAHFIRPTDTEKWEMFHMCLTVIGLARAFYHDAYGWRADEGCKDPESARLLRLGEEAKQFRAAFFEIGMRRLGTKKPGPQASAQALRELESCTRWIKKKGLRSWLVLQSPDHDSGRHEWEPIEPAQYVSKMFDIISRADNRRREIKEAKARQEEEAKRGKKK